MLNHQVYSRIVVSRRTHPGRQFTSGETCDVIVGVSVVAGIISAMDGTVDVVADCKRIILLFLV